MSDDGIDLLLARYLDGTAGREAVERLDHQLANDARLRRELLVLAVLESELAGHFAGNRQHRLPAAAAPRWSRRWLAGSLLAVAALLALAITWWWPRYDWRVDPILHLSGGSGLRGAKVEAGDVPGGLELGGYCRLELAPATTIEVVGQPFAERFRLHRGRLDCDIEPGVGTFTVVTDLGTVDVRGTRFTISLDEARSATMSIRTLLVKVVVGTVMVSGITGEEPVTAGGAARRFESADPPETRSADERKIIARGTVVGTVVGKEEGRLTVCSVDGVTVTYLGHWEGGRQVTRGVDLVSAGDLVILAWAVNDHPRVLSVERLALRNGAEVVSLDRAGDPPPPGAGIGPHQSQDPPAKQRDAATGRWTGTGEGTVVGTVLRKERTWVEVVSLSGQVDRYLPEWRGGLPKDGGGFDPGILELIATLRKGDLVQIRWSISEHLRALSITVLRAAEAEGAPREGRDDPPREGRENPPREGVEPHRREGAEHRIPAGQGAVSDPPERRTPGKDGRDHAIATGTTIGVVLEMGKGWVQVRSTSGQVDRYIPEWVGGMPAAGGGPDPMVIRQIDALKPGDRVRVSWYVNDHLRLESIKRIGD